MASGRPQLHGVSRCAALNETIEMVAVAPELVHDGNPRVGFKLVDSIPGIEIGIWEHTPGTSMDIEEHEAFVVLSGRATVVVDGGPTCEFNTGDIGFLVAGTATRWIVHETFRKVFVCAVESQSDTF